MKKQPLKEMLKKIGGVKKLTEAKAIVGFSEEMGALYISKRGQNNGKSYELKKADIEQIIKQYKKFKSKLD